MFTGIVENKSVILRHDKGLLSISNPWPSSEVQLGQSISINGCCLTVVASSDQNIDFDLSPETYQKTNFSKKKVSHYVNLERAVSANKGLDGHVVSGHIDGVAQVVDVKLVEENYHKIVFQVENQFSGFLIPKGSVAIDGISLTVNEVNQNQFSVMIIPHTWNHTVIHSVKVGDTVNIEYDMIAKYVEKIVSLKLQQKGAHS